MHHFAVPKYSINIVWYVGTKTIHKQKTEVCIPLKKLVPSTNKYNSFIVLFILHGIGS